MAGFFLHVDGWEIVNFIVIKLVEIIHGGFFTYERQQLRFNLVCGFTLCCNGGDVVSIFVGKHHVFSINFDALCH